MRRGLAVGSIALAMALSFAVLWSTSPSADVDWVMGDISRVAGALGIQPTHEGKYDLAEILTAIVQALPVADGKRQLCWLNEFTSFHTGERIKLEFQTTPNSDCSLCVVFQGTGRASTSPEATTTKRSDAEGQVSWEWALEAKPDQAARVVLLVDHRDGTKDWESWTFYVLLSQES